MSIEAILARQNPDGGWSYRQGGSWTEPTVYALLAALAEGETGAASRGFRWLLKTRQEDGGWPARPEVPGSCWTTGLVALLPPEQIGAQVHRGAVEWLLNACGADYTLIYKLRQRLLGGIISGERPGWSWVPGTAAWVGPTSIAIAALEKERRRGPARQLHERIEDGQSYLLNRMCTGGGWNTGSSHALGYASLPYPETTGLALLALRGVKSPKVEQSLSLAEKFLKDSPTADAQNWLRLGLAAHGRLPNGYRPPAGIAYRTVPELAVRALADAADRGQQDFLV